MWGHQFFGRKSFQFPALLLIAFSALILLFNFLQSPDTIWVNHPKRVYPIGHSADVRRHLPNRIRNNWRMEIAATAEREKGMATKMAEEKGDGNALGNDALMAEKAEQKIQRNGPPIVDGPKSTVYPTRLNMGPCPPRFGRITVLVIVVESSYKTHYAVAQRSLECYLRTTNYTFRLVDLDHDERVNRHCKHDQLFFKKQCAVSIYLSDSDWTLVLDADAGVVNPNHCIEEWIDDRVDLIFYERFFNWEVASGNYLAKNTEFARAFIMDWANMQYTQPKNFSGADNGALQLHILRTVIPGAKAEAKACQKIWQLSNSYERYMGYVTCVKVALGATRLWPGKLRILRRAHGWVRDWFLTTDSWSQKDFMLHGWKAQNLSQGWQSPFRQVPVPSECTGGYAGWNWRNEMRVSVEEIRRQLAQVERSSGFGYPAVGRNLPYLSEPDVGECYPDCDQLT